MCVSTKKNRSEKLRTICIRFIIQTIISNNKIAPIWLEDDATPFLIGEIILVQLDAGHVNDIENNNSVDDYEYMTNYYDNECRVCRYEIWGLLYFRIWGSHFEDGS